MKKLLLLAAVLLLAAPGIRAQVINPNAFENYISVTGKSEREVVPNEIYVRIVINENDTKGKVPVEQQQRRMIDALKKLGVDVEKQLQIGDLSSDMKSYVLRRNQVLTTKTYRLKLTSGEQTAAVFQALGELGISNMAVTKTTHSDLEGIKQELRVEAMKNAQNIARTLAEAVGQQAGKAIYIADNDNFFEGSVRMLNANFAMAKSAGAADTAESEPVLEFQDLKLRYSVFVKFVLE